MNSYYPVPGHTHLRLLVPKESPAAAAPREHERPSLSPLVKVALDAAFGIRQITDLRAHQFGVTVRAHVSARRRAGLISGPVRIMSSHAGGGGEFYGSADCAGKRYAWAARIDEGRLVSFKVL